MSTSQFFISAWNFSPAVLLSGAAAIVWYLAVFGRDRRLGWFCAGIAVLWLTLLSPLNALADGYLFNAHMAQHILLLLIAPALLLLGLPRWPLPPWRMLDHPVMGWISGMGAMWFWHVPALCNAAVASRPIHAVQTLSLLALGSLFWRQIVFPRDGADGLSPVGAVIYLFGACLTCSLLGIIVTLSPVAVCSIYTMPPADHLAMAQTIRNGWGITPALDQQIGGLLMWVPMCLVYLCAIFAQAVRWFAEPGSTLKRPS
jgi:cytochrome c oxidase assembly factor CtaG